MAPAGTVKTGSSDIKALSPQEYRSLAMGIDLANPPDIQDAELVLGSQFEYAPPSNVALTVFLMGENRTGNKNFTTGVRLPLAKQILSDTAVYFGNGGSNIAFAPLSGNFMPILSWGNIFWQPGGDVRMGFFSLTSIPSYEAIAIGVAMVLVETLLEESRKAGTGSIDWEEFALAFTSNLLIRALPFNILRDVFQKLGFDSSPDVCSVIDDDVDMKACLIHATSFKKQKLFEVANDMIEKGLVSPPDAVTRANLMAQRDAIRGEERRNGPLSNAREELAQGLQEALRDVQEFSGIHWHWLTEGKGEPPSAAALEAFLGKSLYLLQKLSMVLGLDKDGRIILVNTVPFAFDHPWNLAEYLEVTSTAYNIIARSESLWDFIAVGMIDRVKALTLTDGARSPQDYAAEWFELKNLYTLMNELTSSNLHAHFRMRQAHLLNLLKKDHAAKKETPAARERMIAASLLPQKEMVARRAAMEEKLSRFIIDDASDVSVTEARKDLDAASGLINGMEILLRLAEDSDPLAPIVIGLDCTYANDTPAIALGLKILYQLKAEDWGNGDERPTFISHMERLVAQIRERHGKKMAREIANYPRDYAAKVKKLEKDFITVAIEMIRLSLDGNLADIRALYPLIEKLSTLASRTGVADGTSAGIEAIRQMSGEDKRLFERIFKQAYAVFDKEQRKFNAWIDDGSSRSSYRRAKRRLARAAGRPDPTINFDQLRKHPDVLRQEFQKLQQSFDELMEYREGINAMMLFIEEEDRKPKGA